MKVAIFSFQSNTDIIGVKYLHAYIAAKGHNSSVFLLPFDNQEDIESAVSHIIKMSPDVLCFSAMSYEFKRASNFIKALKERFKTPPIIFGGIHATAEPESCLEFSDVVVRGEGEETLAELLSVFKSESLDNLSKIKGIVYKSGNKIIHTGVRGPVHALDSLPYPKHIPESMYVFHRAMARSIKDRQIFRRYARYEGAFLSIASSRGCPFSCNYCCNSMLKSFYGDNSIRNRSVNSVIDEIKGDISTFNEILYVNFVDDCFMMHPQSWIADFSLKYRKEINIPFVIRSTPRHINREKIALLRKAGLRWVFMGLQSGSDRVNKDVYGRLATAEDFLKAAKVISEFKISPWYDVILDNPYETEQDQLSTIDVLLRTARPFQVSLFSLDFFPGTELLRRVNEDGISVPSLGSKSYTEPEPKMINRYVRMCGTLPPFLVRSLVSLRGLSIGKGIGWFFYSLAIMLEPFMYIRLVFQSNDFRMIRTLRVIKAFYIRSINKLLFRKIA